MGVAGWGRATGRGDESVTGSTKHKTPTEAIRGQAALYALGALDEDEAGRLEDHLQEDCQTCTGELESFRTVAFGLSIAPIPVEPPPAVRTELLKRISSQSLSEDAPSQVWKAWPGSDLSVPLLTVRAGEQNWEETSFPGVRVRRLSSDPARDCVTMLVKMASGSHYPRHRHGGVEECFVLEGDLHVGDRVLYAGDYQRASGDSVHEVQSTVGGCTLFILSSLQDELLA